MNAKNHIINRMAALKTGAVDCSVKNLNRYIDGSRTPDIATARAISQATGSPKNFWLNRLLVGERKTVLEQYAKKNNLPLYMGKGRPRKESILQTLNSFTMPSIMCWFCLVSVSVIIAGAIA